MFHLHDNGHVQFELVNHVYLKYMCMYLKYMLSSIVHLEEDKEWFQTHTDTSQVLAVKLSLFSPACEPSLNDSVPLLSI